MKKTMMMVGSVLFAAWVMGATPPSVTQPATVPGQVNFQGLLRNPNTGVLYTNGIYTLEFKLYTTITGGNPLWGESYQVYVRDGYFNVMLGESGKEVSGTKPTYRGENLWKALWFNSSSNNRELWLSVTPWEDSAHNGIAAENRKEISPRQKLLTTPFAFRAQSAEYAEKAIGAFSVGGKLTVNGALEVKGGQSGINLQHVATSATELTLGNTDGTPNTVTVQGNTVKVKANSGLSVVPGGSLDVQMKSGKSASITGGTLTASPDGNATVTVKSDKMFKVSGGDFRVHNKWTGIDSSNIVLEAPNAETYITSEYAGFQVETSSGGRSNIEAAGDKLNLNASGTGDISVDGDVHVMSNKKNLYLYGRNELHLAADYVKGSGVFWWEKPNGMFSTPFLKKAMEIQTSNSSAEVKVGVDTADYHSWMVVGVDTGSQKYHAHAAVIMKNGVPYVKVYGDGSNTVTVYLLGIHKSFISGFDL